MRLFPILCVGAVVLTACSPAPKGVDGQKLSDAVAAAVGDPNTCVLLVEQGGGQKVFQYGEPSVCMQKLADCAGGELSANALGALAAKGDDRAVSCDNPKDANLRIAWATGKVTPGADAKYAPLAYAVVMNSENALPGREIKARMDTALARGGM